jgi:hypothetical protein
LVPSAAQAQEPGDVGLFMGYPNLGLFWQVSEKVALRPEISFSISDFSSNSNANLATSSWTVGFGASALFYITNDDKLRTYVAPRFTYTHSGSDSSGSVAGSTNDSYLVAGLFGGQYALSDRFAVFGEVGVGYTHSINQNEFSGSKLTQNNVNTRTGIGAILFF